MIEFRNSSWICLLLLVNLALSRGSGGNVWPHNLLEDYDDPPVQIVPTTPPYTYSQPRNSYRISRTLKPKQSLILVGEMCDPTDPTYSKCSHNANCVHFPQDNVYRCNCSYSYEPTSSRRCLRAFGHYCDTKDPCNHEAFLSCIDNKCLCENSKVYQNGEDQCKSKVGGPCSPPSSSSGPECIANAVCLSFDKFGRRSRCVCRDGFLETSGGLCSLGIGMGCHGKGECNSEVPLVCKEGVCSCREAVEVYDQEMQACVGLVGSQCCTNFDGVNCPSGVTNGCVSGAYCKKTSNNLPGRCVCQSYNLESDERQCSPNPTFGKVMAGKVY